MTRGDLNDRQWERLKPLLPARNVQDVHADDRQILNGVLWYLRTGATWRDSPGWIWPLRDVYSRFYRWQDQGAWTRFLRLYRHNRMPLVDSTRRSTMSMARRYAPTNRAAGAEGDRVTEALGRSRGGLSTKLHLRIEGQGKLMTIVLTPGQQHKATVFETLMEQGAVKRPGRGRPRLRPDRVVGDKGYSSRAIRGYAHRHGIRITIPRRSNERRHGPSVRSMTGLRTDPSHRGLAPARTDYI